MIEHDQSQLYKDILQNSMLLRTIIQVIQNDNDVNSLPMEAKVEELPFKNNVKNYLIFAIPIEVNYSYKFIV